MAPITLTVAQYASRPTRLENLALLREVVTTAAATSPPTTLILFPEVFFGSYPRGTNFGSIIGARTAEGRDEYHAYWRDAVDLGDTHPEGLGEYTHAGDGTREELEKIARETGVWIGVGLLEKARGCSTMWCAAATVSPVDGIVGKRRKVMPTASEKICWGVGSPATLKAARGDLAGQDVTIGAAICWENYSPLLRASLYQQGVDLYLAPTADGRTSWQSTVQHIAMEGRCVVMSANQFVPDEATIEEGGLEKAWEAAEKAVEGKQEPKVPSVKSCAGGSAIYGPLGECLAGPIWGKEGTASYTFEDGEWERRIVGSRLDFDIGRGGHYSRADAFKLTVTGLEL